MFLVRNKNGRAVITRTGQATVPEQPLFAGLAVSISEVLWEGDEVPGVLAGSEVGVSSGKSYSSIVAVV